MKKKDKRTNFQRFPLTNSPRDPMNPRRCFNPPELGKPRDIPIQNEIVFTDDCSTSNIMIVKLIRMLSTINL